ncbi:MAG: hypothetical protein WC869_01085 [Phycisphaerae bacterium]|jgi:hypothetical protein
MKKTTIPKSIKTTLLDWDDCGNTVLSHDGGMIAYSELKPGIWHQVSFTPGNYPAFYSGVISMSRWSLAKHINENLTGWDVHKCNVPGVKVNPSNRVGVDDA